MYFTSQFYINIKFLIVTGHSILFLTSVQLLLTNYRITEFEDSNDFGYH